MEFDASERCAGGSERGEDGHVWSGESKITSKSKSKSKIPPSPMATARYGKIKDPTRGGSLLR